MTSETQISEVQSTAMLKSESRALPPEMKTLNALPESDRELLMRRLGESSECFFDPSFEEPDAELRFGGPLPLFTPAPARSRRRRDPIDVDYVGASSRVTLTVEQERNLFQRLNYARWRVLRVMEQFVNRPLTREALRDLLRWESLVQRTRNEIVRVNVPLVLAMARRTKITGVDLSDLVSEGNLALLRSVDKFDSSRGFKFSTYACRAILKAFSRVATRTGRYRGHFPTEFDPTLEKSDYSDQRRRDIEDRYVNELRWILGKNLANLSDVEQTVIRARFAIDDAAEAPEASRARTLEQVGEMIGVTKERVRQIQNKALGKLKTILESDALSA